MLSGLVYNLAMIDRKLSEYFAMMGRKSAKVTNENSLGQTTEANRSECCKGTVGQTEA
jgi:hypothetical protein